MDSQIKRKRNISPFTIEEISLFKEYIDKIKLATLEKHIAQGWYFPISAIDLKAAFHNFSELENASLFNEFFSNYCSEEGIKKVKIAFGKFKLKTKQETILLSKTNFERLKNFKKLTGAQSEDEAFSYLFERDVDDEEILHDVNNSVSFDSLSIDEKYLLFLKNLQYFQKKRLLNVMKDTLKQGFEDGLKYKKITPERVEVSIEKNKYIQNLIKSIKG